jgi:hypothetical protein
MKKNWIAGNTSYYTTNGIIFFNAKKLACCFS